MLENYNEITGIEGYLNPKSYSIYQNKANNMNESYDTWDSTNNTTTRRLAKFKFALGKIIYIHKWTEQIIKKESVKDIIDLFNRLCEQDIIYKVFGNLCYMKVDTDNIPYNKYFVILCPLVWDDINFKDNDLYVNECEIPKVEYYQDKIKDSCTCSGWQLFHIGCNCGWLSATKKA